MDRCQCKEGYAPPRCDKCLEGFYGFPDCKPCNCFYPGKSHSKVCNVTNGQCDCKDGSSGRQCSPCSPGYYLSSYDYSYEYRASAVCYLDQKICNTFVLMSLYFHLFSDKLITTFDKFSGKKQNSQYQ